MNFKNQLIFGKDMDNDKVGSFFWDTVYNLLIIICYYALRPSVRLTAFKHYCIIRRHRSKASDFAYSYPLLRSICGQSVCRLSHSCTLLKPFNELTCYLV